MAEPAPIVRTPRPPVPLVVALVIMWLLGMYAVADGVRTIEIVRSPVGEVLEAFDGSDIGAIAQRAFVSGVSAHARALLPLGVAQLLLGSLLAVLAIRGLFWRRGSTSLALQVVGANAALVMLGYYLHDPVRRAVVEAVVADLAKQSPPEVSPAEFAAMARTNLWWSFRLWLIAQLVGFGFCAAVVARRSVRQLWAAPDGRDAGEG